MRFIVGVRALRDQGLHAERPYDDLDFALNLQCLSQCARGARNRPRSLTHIRSDLCSDSDSERAGQ